MRVWTKIATTQRGDQGSSLVEYALVLSLIALVAIGALRVIGVQVDVDLRQLIDSLW